MLAMTPSAARSFIDLTGDATDSDEDEHIAHAAVAAKFGLDILTKSRSSIAHRGYAGVTNAIPPLKASVGQRESFDGTAISASLSSDPKPPAEEARSDGLQVQPHPTSPASKTPDPSATKAHSPIDQTYGSQLRRARFGEKNEQHSTRSANADIRPKLETRPGVNEGKQIGELLQWSATIFKSTDVPSREPEQPSPISRSNSSDSTSARSNSVRDTARLPTSVMSLPFVRNDLGNRRPMIKLNYKAPASRNVLEHSNNSTMSHAVKRTVTGDRKSTEHPLAWADKVEGKIESILAINRENLEASKDILADGQISPQSNNAMSTLHSPPRAIQSSHLLTSAMAIPPKPPTPIVSKPLELFSSASAKVVQTTPSAIASSVYSKYSDSVDKFRSTEASRGCIHEPGAHPAPKPLLEQRLDDVKQALAREGLFPTHAELENVGSLLAHAGRGAINGAPYDSRLDELIVFLKERAAMSWHVMIEFFPGRNTWHSLQTRYSSKLKGSRTIPRPWTGDNTISTTRASLISPPQHMVIEPTSMIHSGSLPITRKSTRLEGSDLSKPGAFAARKAPDAEEVIGETPNFGTDYQTPGVSYHNQSFSSPISTTLIKQPLAARQDFGYENNLMSVRLYDGEREPQLNVTHIDGISKRWMPQHISMEETRDSAAIASLTARISRPPLTEDTKSFPADQVQLRRRKRRSVDVNRPYLAYSERCILTRSTMSSTYAWDNEEIIDWEGKVVHVDFQDDELEQLVPSIQACRRHTLNKSHRIRQWASESMKHASEREIHEISGHAQSYGVFLSRTRDSMDSFLRDLASNQQGQINCFRKIGIQDARSRRNGNINAGLRSRELGTPGRRKFPQAYDTYGPCLRFTGGSGDVQTIAWSPNGDTFAIGCAAVMDAHSQQYNERNNLIIGNVSSRSLRELPAHAIPRVLTTSGANSTHAMHASQEPLVFSSVSGVQFSTDGKALVSAGYDGKVRIWNLGGINCDRASIKDATCTFIFPHKAPVDILAVGSNGLFATGSQRDADSIKVLRLPEDGEDTRSLKWCSLSSPKAMERPDIGIRPSCIRWGYMPGQQKSYMESQHKYIACGFSSWSSEEKPGQICIWDVVAEQPVADARGSRNVFDVAWSPATFGRFAVGGTPTGNVNRGTQSVVRIYDARRTTCTVELECPALDMNDVVFNPSDEILLSAGCTDGAVYTWDLRMPDTLLHCFKHKESLQPLDEHRAAEEVDTGVRFLSWNLASGHLYSGSSDGVVACWNPYVSPEDAYVRSIAQMHSGVMSGEFSPDYTNLLLGEVNGSITILSPGHEDRKCQDAASFFMEKADDVSLAKARQQAGVVETTQADTSGIEIAHSMLRANVMRVAPFSDFRSPFRGGAAVRQVLQGSAYTGPFDTGKDAPLLRAASMSFQHKLQPSKQPCELEHPVSILTEEEQVDLQYWKLRIPERLHWPGFGSDGIAVRPRDPLRKQCFRCGVSTLVPHNVHEAHEDILCCQQCRLAWRYDVLGYIEVNYDSGVPVHDDSQERIITRVHDHTAIRADVDLLAYVAMQHQALWGANSVSY